MEIPIYSRRQKTQVYTKGYREKKKSSERRRSCEIPITKGFIAIVDSEDFYYLSQFKWYYNDGYAERKENGKHVRMHREIKSVPENFLIDHINGDKLDNRKSNLTPVLDKN